VLHVAEATFSTSQVSYDRQVPFKIAEKTDFEFQAKSSSGDNEVAVFVECVLIKN
jgi:mevalonate kinase